jgi:hypothetical protein
MGALPLFESHDAPLPDGPAREHAAEAIARNENREERRPGVVRDSAAPGRFQRPLFESRVERAFRDWIQTPAGRHVEREVIRLARELRAAGVRRYGIAGIWERLRWDRAVRVPGSAEWKLDNRYRSHLARKVMAEVPELEELFETRDLRGRA